MDRPDLAASWMSGSTVARTGPSPGLSLGVLATSVGGALGALLRWSLTEAVPFASGQFPWTTLLINVAGSGLLAFLPKLEIVARRPWLALFLGTGALGGFTTMSAASVDTFTLFDSGATGMALAYCFGTLAAALAAVLLVERLSTDAQRRDFEERGGDE